LIRIKQPEKLLFLSGRAHRPTRQRQLGRRFANKTP